jgi:hypothetical protein
MNKHRNPQARLSKQPSPDNFKPFKPGLFVDAPIDTVYVIRDSLGKADAFISAAEVLIERPHADGETDAPGRRQNHVEHLIESAKLAVRSALHASGQLDVELRKRVNA